MLAGSAAEHKARVALFAPNTAMCNITEDLVFTDPYRQAPLNRWNHPHLDAHKQAFENDGALKIAAQARKYQFMTSAQALIHGDLHTGSIMVTPADTRVIDPEFAFIGPIGFDVGVVIGNLLLAFFAQDGHEACRTSATAIARGFSTRRRRCGAVSATASWLFGAPRPPATPISRGFSGPNRIARRSRRSGGDLCASFSRFPRLRRRQDDPAYLGLAHVEDLESIADPERRAACEINALRLGRELLLNARGFSDIADVAEAAKAVRGERASA